MVRGSFCIPQRAMDYLILVERERERLANLDVVEWLRQIVHRNVSDHQNIYFTESLAAPLGSNVGRGDKCEVKLICLIRPVHPILIGVEEDGEMLQLGLGTVVVRIGHIVDTLGMRVTYHFPRPSTTALVENRLSPISVGILPLLILS